MKKRISWGGAARFSTAAALLALPMLAFAVEPTDLDGMKTANGKIVAEYLQMFWNDGKLNEAKKKYYSPKMIEHGWLGMSSPPAGAAGADMPPPELPPGAAPVHADIKKVMVQGDLVFVHMHVTGGAGGEPGKPAPRNGELMWVLYRVKDGKIVEHWDTHNPIPDDQVGKQW